MKKTLHTLLIATSLMSVSFAAETPTSECSANSIIIDVTEEVFSYGVLIPWLQFNPETNSFIGSNLTFKILEWSLTIQREPAGFTIQNPKGHLQSSTLVTLTTPYDPEKFYNFLYKAISDIITINNRKPSAPQLRLNSRELFQMRQITARVFPGDPDSWKIAPPDVLYTYSRAIVTEVLKKYHLPSLTDNVKEVTKNLEIEAEAQTSTAEKTYSSNISSDQCPQEIKSAFLKVSEILAISAYYYRAHKLSPLKIFTENSFPTDVAAIITVLFELNDKTRDFQSLSILDSNVQITGLPALSESPHIDFVTRWLNLVLSTSVTKVEALNINQRDSFAFIPEIVKRAEALWDEYERHVFGKTADTVFKKQPK
jgi:hypothetical protein